MAVNTVNSTIKKIAYEKNSLIGYKGYPEQNTESLMNLVQIMVQHPRGAPFARQH
jgi:hypothetical protein